MERPTGGMDELTAFFSGKLSVQKTRGPLTGGFRVTKEDTTTQLDRRQEHRHSAMPSGTDYAVEIKRKENEACLKSVLRQQQLSENRDSLAGGLESIEQLSSFGASIQNLGQLNDEAMTEVYSKYSFQMKEDTKSLEINKVKQEILDRIFGYDVVIIEGPTGCGKTTQVPQWVLDDCYQKRKPCKIVVTQPRRIAAISIAKRVAHERGWDVGGLVGYQIGLDNKITPDTRICYVTTGVLLQKLVASKTLNEYTHVILDEVHERGQDMDFLLLVVKRLLYTVSQGVKVILMSATFNTEAFQKFFSLREMGGLSNVISVSIPKAPRFPVKIFYLDHIQKLGDVVNKAFNEQPMMGEEMHHLIIKLLNAFEQIEQREEGYTDRSQIDFTSVLVFLPGINEIEDLYMCLEDRNLRAKIGGEMCAKYSWWVLPLHSTITSDEQARVFQRSSPGTRKIILATNIAESSITVPDIEYVIDVCLMKTLVADPNTNFTSLELTWASRSNCEQRAGRAGRVREGRVYRLIKESFWKTLPYECVPEIKRCPLERLTLLAKMLDMGPPKDVLALAMDPPDASNIHRTILVLKEIGAMKKLMNKEWCPDDGEITYFGYIMAKLPIDVRCSKLIVLGYIFGCLEEAIIMAAAMSVKSVFSSPFLERLNAYNSKLTWADGSTSDCMAFLNVYKVWNHLRRQNSFRQPGDSEGHWARRFYVQARALKDLDDLVRELKMRLSREGIEISQEPSPWEKREIPTVLKLILAGAVYPQYFVQVSVNEQRERDAVRILGGFNPRNTVYLKNFPENQPGEVYAAAIKKAIRKHISDEPSVHFDKNSRKVYLSFEDQMASSTSQANKPQDPSIPGQVVLPVYKAVKARQLKMNIRIPLLPVEEANALAEAFNEERTEININRFVPRLPDIDDTHFHLVITEIVSAGKFWVQYDDESTAQEVQKITQSLNRGPLLVHTGRVDAGDVLAAARAHASVQRVRVLKALPRNVYEVLFIDYGTVCSVKGSDLHQLPPGCCLDTPPLAMCCVLAELSPSPLMDSHARWAKEAVMLLERYKNRRPLIAKVYSVSHGIVAIELLASGGRISVNQELVNHGLAVPAEESYDSKMNHDLRETAADLEMVQKRAYNKEQKEAAYYHMREIEAPNPKDCKSDVCLVGPFSPLETVVHNMMYASRDKQVAIEWHSVNSVLLDTEPQEIYERMLVAGEVGQNERSGKLTLRHTTIMPNIPGLPAIIAFIFCPFAELRRDSAGTRYVSALCGLGSHPDGTPYFPEHDLLVNIDADLTIVDIGTINHIRHLMDYGMNMEDAQETLTSKERMAVTGILRGDILKLLHARRTHREPQYVLNAWQWGLVPEQEMMEINEPGMIERAVVYMLHTPHQLQNLPEEYVMQIIKETEDLKLLVARTSIASNTQLSCKLCGTAPMPAHALRIHLYSNAHRDMEQMYNTGLICKEAS